jgi:ABC-type Fe3+/spermidine/putrescine transport system ATPase subunit
VTGAATPLLRITGLTVRYGAVEALSALDLSVGAGELFVLLGGSGSGKSTLLRAVAGFVPPAAGRIELDGLDLGPLPPHRRPVNTMFQSYALFPHMSVSANIAFGPRQQGTSRAAAAALAEEMLALVRLDGLGQRRPHQLSGGQQQRVALARSLAGRPRLLLLDEPLSALDRGLRAETRDELMRVNRRTGTSFIVVTHDQEEALTMADRIGIVHQGRIAQVGRPADLYETPASRFVATFMGSANILDGRPAAGGAAFQAPGLGMTLRVRHPPAPDAAWVAIRAERIRLGDDPAEPNRAEGTIVERSYAGESLGLAVRLDAGATLRVRHPLGQGLNGDLPAVGTRVALSWSADACVPLVA